MLDVGLWHPAVIASYRATAARPALDQVEHEAGGADFAQYRLGNHDDRQRLLGVGSTLE